MLRFVVREVAPRKWVVLDTTKDGKKVAGPCRESQARDTANYWNLNAQVRP